MAVDGVSANSQDGSGPGGDVAPTGSASVRDARLPCRSAASGFPRLRGARASLAALLALAVAGGCATNPEAELPVPQLRDTTAQPTHRSTTNITPTTDTAPPPAPSPSPSAETSGSQPFSAAVRRIGPGLRERMRFSYRSGCPVSQADLRYLRLSLVTFDGSVSTGEIVVHKRYADAVIQVFRRLYESGWPIRRMRLVDDYRGSDELSLAANNTSGYNCRKVAGGQGWSEHAYGRAIDINPVQNPYVQRSSVAPPAGRRYAAIDRSAGAAVPPGVIRSDDVVVSAFARIGWQWGGEWTSSKDYQHFSASGR